MKLGIRARLFFAVLAACALVVVANGLMARLLFERTFMGYLNDQGVARMHEVLPRLAAGYREHGSWDFMRDNLDAWRAIMHANLARNAPPGTRPVSDQTGAVPRFALFDAHGARVMGNPEAGPDAVRLPVSVDGRTVGWLAMIPFQQAIASGDVRFYQAQVRGWWTNGVISVLVAAALAWLLSRALLKRVGGMAGAIHRLASGDYAVRIPSNDRDELDQLAHDVNRLADTLEHTERSRRSFMADISHELRTPLAVLRAELEAIQDGIRPMTPATLAPLQGEVQQLGKLIDDLYELSVTQVGEVSYQFAPLDLDELAQSVAAGMRGRFADAGLDLQALPAAPPARVRGDERRLLQLLANLLENALRYTDRGGQVVMRVIGGQERVELVIEDSAPGVGAEGRARLFERFYRVESSRNRASGGSGLGLAICQNIVQAHGGTIRAEASALGGLRIVASLPEAP